jgi:RimJ/RimL family protein N-acetyltransferase
VISLTPFGAEHLDGVERMLDDPALLRFTRVPEPVPPGFAREWLDAYERGRADGTREAFAIVDGDSTFLGLALAPSIALDRAEAELGYVVSPDARGRGVATAALEQLTAWTFATLPIERIELLISAANEPSKRVAARCGYVFEGRLRSAYVKPGVRDDTEIWSRLRTD